MTRPRFPELKKDASGKLVCRGCGDAVPRGRQTWCSFACQLLRHPFYVKIAVKKRSGERCEKCGKDCSRAANQEYHKNRPKAPEYHRDCGLPYPYNHSALSSHPLYVAYLAELKAFSAAEPTPEFDHIFPHSEGGEYVLENIRLLCKRCHRQRTRDWHKTRINARPSAQE